MIYYTCVIIDKVEKTGLVYSSIPTGSGVSGPDETKVNYEEVTGSKNKHVCLYVYTNIMQMMVLFNSNL